MEDLGSIHTILDFLQRNGFSRAEAALRSELDSCPDINGLQERSLVKKEASIELEREYIEKQVVKNLEYNLKQGGEASEELIVKEIECGIAKNGSDSDWPTTVVKADQKIPREVDISDENFILSKGSEDTMLDLYSLKFDPSDGSVVKSKSSELQAPGKPQYHTASIANKGKFSSKPAEEMIMIENQRKSWVGSTSRADEDQTCQRNVMTNLKDVNRRAKGATLYSEDTVDDQWARTDAASSSFSDQLKECSVNTVFPFSGMDIPTYDNSIGSGDKKDDKRKIEAADIRAAIKEQVDEVGRSLYLTELQGICAQSHLSNLGLPLISEDQKEELPRLPPVRLKSDDRSVNANWQDKFDRDGQNLKLHGSENSYLIGTFLDVPVGQEINSSGGKRIVGGSWLSVSQGIAEDTSDLVSGFATAGDGSSGSVDYPNEYWYSDEYEDDDDVGYMRQPIEDEAWFLAHEIDYPSDNEKGTAHGSAPEPQERPPAKVEDDDQSFAEEDSYFSGEQYMLSKNVKPASDDPIGPLVTEVYGGDDVNEPMQYDEQLMDEEELSLMRHEPVWQGFVTQSNDLIMFGDGEFVNNCGRSGPDDILVNDDRHGSVRSIGVGINSDAADIVNDIRGPLIGGTSEDLEYFHGHDAGTGESGHLQCEFSQKCNEKSIKDKKKINKHDSDKYILENVKIAYTRGKNHTDDGFSFPPPIGGTQLVEVGSSKSLWSTNNNPDVGDETDSDFNTMVANDDMLSSWRHKKK